MYTTKHYHLQENLLKVFQKYKQNMMGSTKDVQNERIQRRHFPVVKENIKGTIDIIHSYFFKSMSFRSLSGYVYYVSFIDDFSRKTWIYLLKGKNEVFNKFKEFKSLVKNDIERNIKTLWSVNGR